MFLMYKPNKANCSQQVADQSQPSRHSSPGRNAATLVSLSQQHQQAEVYICPRCSKGFPSSQSLGGHQNAHRKERSAERRLLWEESQAEKKMMSENKLKKANHKAAREKVPHQERAPALIVNNKSNDHNERFQYSRCGIPFDVCKMLKVPREERENNIIRARCFADHQAPYNYWLLGGSSSNASHDHGGRAYAGGDHVAVKSGFGDGKKSGEVIASKPPLDLRLKL